ncbi:MAG: hypothetical protein MZV63_23485 [Marinilabiliales bacterium]|nr:hypothetical protein [Marinilabiliales bacterium]
MITLLRHQYFVLLSGNEGERGGLQRSSSGNMIRVDEDYAHFAHFLLKKLFTVPADGA